MFKTTATTHIRERDGERFVKMREVGFRRQSLPAARIVSELAANSLYPQIQVYKICITNIKTQQIQRPAATRIVSHLAANALYTHNNGWRQPGFFLSGSLPHLLALLIPNVGWAT